MFWKCSECGNHFENLKKPDTCSVCGTAGAAFTPTYMQHRDVRDDGNISTWTKMGMLWSNALEDNFEGVSY